LVKRYGGRAVVDALDLAVPAGRVTALLGPNGAGKSTTIEICCGLRRRDAGEVRVLGLDPARDAAALRPRLGVMLQEGGVYSGATARQMLHHVAALHAHPLDPEALLTRLGLGDTGRTTYRRLSGGQKQLLALGLAIIGRPELVFLDEPTAGLDPHARHATWTLIRDLRGAGVTVVLATHLMDEAERLADQVLIIDRGRCVAAGSPAELTGGSRRLEDVFFELTTPAQR
jgi:ABC-2 type transport system ATP-binding protein